MLLNQAVVFLWLAPGRYQISRSNQDNSGNCRPPVTSAAVARYHVKELLPEFRTANIDCIHSEKKQIVLEYLLPCNSQVIHCITGLSTYFTTLTHNLKKFGTLSQSIFTHPVHKKIPVKIWLQYPTAKMQQQRHFTGFLVFFWRGTSHNAAILHRCVAHLYASKGFQPAPALQCPWLLVKTLSNCKKLLCLLYCRLKK